MAQQVFDVTFNVPLATHDQTKPEKRVRNPRRSGILSSPHVCTPNPVVPAALII